MLWKCRVSVLTRDLCHVSLYGVNNMTTQALSHFIIWRRDKYANELSGLN